MYEYGFLGTGNMGSALVSALSQSDADMSLTALSNRTPAKAESLAQKFGCVATENADIAENAYYIILGVKPQVLPAVASEIAPLLKKNAEKYGRKPILVTMAAGITMETLCEFMGDIYPVIRIMPNTPVSIGQGVILAAKNECTSDEDFAKFVKHFSAAGTIKELPENLIDSASVVSGCGPAYIYMYIDALAKAGESLGLDYETAAELAKATARGAAMLSEKSSESLDSLREAVCSPGGSTIEGVKSMLAADLDGTVKEALLSAYNRTKELAGEK